MYEQYEPIIHSKCIMINWTDNCLNENEKKSQINDYFANCVNSNKTLHKLRYHSKNDD